MSVDLKNIELVISHLDVATVEENFQEERQKLGDIGEGGGHF